MLVPNGKSLGILLGDKYPTNSNTGTFSFNFQYNNISATTNETFFTTTTEDIFATESTSAENISLPMEKFENSESNELSNSWGIFFTVLGVVLLDLNCDACQSPCRTYLLDVSTPEDHSRGLSTFTLLAGAGGSLGYLLGAINWEQTHFGESFGGHVRVVFTLVLFIYLICVTLTLTSVKEIPLAKLGVRKENIQRPKKYKSGRKYKKFVNEDSSSDEEKPQVTSEAIPELYGSLQLTMNGQVAGHTKETDHQVKQIALQYHSQQELIKQQKLHNSDPGQQDQAHDTTNEHVNSQKSEESVQNHTHDNKIQRYEMFEETHLQPADISLKTYLLSIVRMPRSMLVLCLTNLFCWMSLVCYSLYFTDFVGQTVFGGDPSAPGK
jgi:solute carrier family 45 protein 1/2/4